MKINRRQFIRMGTTCAVAAGFGFSATRLHAQGGPIPLKRGSELEEYKKAQATLLKKHRVRAESRFVKLKKPPLTVHLLEGGRGEPVVMLHFGAYACSYAPLMSFLQKEFRLFAPDRPGAGLTDGFDYRGVSLREHAIDFVAGILDVLDLTAVPLVGSSMGGLYALQFALAKPDRVTRLVLIGSPMWTSPTRPPAIQAESTVESIRAQWNRVAADPNHITEELVTANLAAKRVQDPMSYDTQREEMLKQNWGTYHLRPELKNLRPPALFIWGDTDKSRPPNPGQEMAALAPNARCEILRDASHVFPWFDQPEACSRLVVEFLKGGR